MTLDTSIRRPHGRLRIGIAINAQRVMRWNTWLAEALGRRHEVIVLLVRSTSGGTMPISVRLALQLERIIYRAPELCAVDQSELPDFPVEELDRQHQSFDVLIDCSGGEAAIPQVDRLLRLTFNGVPSEVGAVSALFDGGDTVLAVVDGKSGVTIAETFPALSDRRIIGRSLNETCSMAVELLCATVDRSAIPAYRLPNLPAPAAP